MNQGIVNGEDGFTNAEISIYPNPVTHTLNISMLEASGKDYLIYNAVGQVILKGMYNESLDVSNLSNGVYILQINTDKEQFRKRFIKE